MKIIRPLLLVSLLASAAVNVKADVVINEIHSAPADKTVPEEFVELYNTADSPVDLSGWYFSDGISFVFPEGTVIGPHAYLVVAQDPETLTDIYGDFPVLGPFSGRLDNDGELVRLRDAEGGRVDSVDYRRRFPWPIAGGSEGYSLELVNPALDNNLGSSWRLSNPSLDDSRVLVGEGAQWKYRKGTEEASSPRGAWREAEFDDSSWATGKAPVGYGENFIATTLSDMRNGYTSFYLRVTFQIEDPEEIRGLVLEAVFDDGFNAWINGVHVAGSNAPSEDPAFDATASGTREDHDFNDFRLPDPAEYLRAGKNVLAVHVLNASLGGSSDAFFDARLTVGSSAGTGPTPGAQNAVFASNIPPQLRQVKHDPEQPTSSDPVLVTVKATDPDGVARVTLEYQIVAPDEYIRLTDPEYETEWTAV